MKSLPTLSAVLSAIALFAVPFGASAHEQQVFRIGDRNYSFEVGSVTEPIIVDDTAAVFLDVALASEHGEDEEEDHHANSANAVEGLESSLRVEISTGDKKKALDLVPIPGAPGTYQAQFIPTVETTFTYRFFGTMNKTPIDVRFTCNPAGHPLSGADTEPTDITPGVTRLLKKGAFGCPIAKSDLGFPEPAPSLAELKEAQAGTVWNSIGTAAGLLALVLSVVALMRKSSR